MSEVRLINVNKVYDNNVQAVFDFNLDIKDGEFIVFVGPSGCGKSTTLRMIAGLEEITDGELYIDDVYCNDIPPKKRDVSMVFQNYALYPHMSVYENMAFGLKNRHVDKAEIDKRVREASEILGISEYLNRKPKALSGGQCQRVALGRAIVRHAKVFLMDEPLSNLDAKLRVQMRSELIKLHKHIGGITIYVTHDQTEAMTMADRIVVMSKGYIQQIGTPKDIYNHPINKFVAGFMGSPTMNFITAKYNSKFISFCNEKGLIPLSKKEDEIHKQFYENEIKFIKDKLEMLQSRIDDYVKSYIGNINEDKQYQEYLTAKEILESKINNYQQYLNNSHDIILGIRPEDISISDKGLEAKVDVVELLGKEQIVHVVVDETKIDLLISSKVDIHIGDTIYLNFDKNSVHLFDIESEKALF